MQNIAFGSGVDGGVGLAAVGDAHGADDARFIAVCLQNGCQKICRGRFSLGARDADDGKLPLRMRKEDIGKHGKRGAGVFKENDGGILR